MCRLQSHSQVLHGHLCLYCLFLAIEMPKGWGESMAEGGRSTSEWAGGSLPSLAAQHLWYVRELWHRGGLKWLLRPNTDVGKVRRDYPRSTPLALAGGWRQVQDWWNRAQLESDPLHLLHPFSLCIPPTLLLSFTCCSVPLCWTWDGEPGAASLSLPRPLTCLLLSSSN